MKSKQIIIFFIIVHVCTCCSSVNKTRSNCTLIEGKYVAKTDWYEEIIEIQSNGSFYLILERGNLTGLAESCKTQQGTWLIKEDTLILNTDFQNLIDDYFALEGDRKDDSIEITMYSLNTMSICNEPMCIVDYGFYYPDSNGKIILSCLQKKQLASFVRVSLSSPVNESFRDDDIECGKKYRLYVRDCYPVVYKQRKFMIMGTGILDCKYSVLYRHCNVN